MKILSDIVKQSNEYLDTKPIGVYGNVDNCVYSSVPNPTGLIYNDLIDVFVYSQYAQIKFRDPDICVEYQLSMLYWKNGFNWNTWADDKNGFTTKLLSFPYIRTDEEYFQLSTINDTSTISLDDIINVKKLMYRFYNYFKIVPAGGSHEST